MNISISGVQSVFADLIEGTISRDEADRWAYSMMQYLEADSLMFEPPSDEEKIWSGIMYLHGIDLMTPTGQYLHSLDDIREAKAKYS